MKTLTAEELFLQKYGNKITASDSWVIRFAEEFADQFIPKQEDKWIDVNKQLPDDLEDVLTVHIGNEEFEGPSGVTVGYYNKDSEQFKETNGTLDGELLITHWQPLPSPPLTDNKEETNKTK